jgi:hypothetical protein
MEMIRKIDRKYIVEIREINMPRGMAKEKFVRNT